MARPVDEQIVKMKLDKAEFESNANRTISIFGRLTNAFKNTKGVDLSKSVSSIKDLNSAADATTMSKLLGAVENVSSRFSTMGIIAMTVLQNITNRAIDAGAALIKSFTLDQMNEGWAEYELKMGSIQTIQASTGESLESISGYLDELNTYADKTIYSFADMTANIGKFTNAGVSLKDAVAAIQGVSNVAAVSGANANEASRAMYNFAQALSAGHVKLIDWKSIETANMATVEFKNQLLEAGVEAGTLSKQADGMYKVLSKNSTGGTMDETIDATTNFNDSLQQQWMTTDVLVDTLSDYADETTEIGAKAFAAAQDVKTFTQLLDTLKEAAGSGWAKTFELLVGDFEEAKELWTGVNNVMSGIIDGMSDARNELIQGFVDLGGRDTIINTFSNLFQALVVGVNSIKGAFQSIFPPTTAKSLMDMAKAIESFTKGLIMSEETASKVQTIFTGLFSVFDAGITIIKQIGTALLDMLPSGIGGGALDFLVGIAESLISLNDIVQSSTGLPDLLAKISSSVRGAASGLGDFVTGIFGFIKGAVAGLQPLTDSLVTIVKAIGSGIMDFIGSIDSQDILNAGFIGGILLMLKKFKGFKEAISDLFGSFTGMFDGLKDSLSIFDKLGETLQAFTGAVKVGSLVAIAVAVGILAVSLKLMEGIDAQDITKGLTALGSILVGLTAGLAVIGKTDISGLGGFKTSAILVSLATSILLIAAGLKVLSTIDEEDMTRSLTALVTIVVSLVGAVRLMSSASGKMMTGGVALIGLAVAVNIMASAVKKLSDIDAADLSKAVLTMGIVMLELAAFVLIVEGSKLKLSTAIGLVAVVAAVRLMAGAIEKIGALPADQIVKGLAAIGLVVVGLGAFVKMTSGSKMLGASIGVIAMAVAIRMLVGPLKELGGMDTQTLIQGLSGLAIVMGEMVLAMQLAKGGLGGAAAMVVMATAIAILVPPLKALGEMSPAAVATALITLAGAFAIIGVTAMLLAPAGGALLMFGAAVMMLGIGLGMIGIGLAAFAVGISSLAALTATAIASMIESFGLILEGLITLVPQLVELAATLVVHLAAALVEATPVIISAAGEIILALLQGLLQYVPQIVTVAVELIVAFAQALGEGVPTIVVAGVQLIIDLIRGMSDAIRNQGPELVSAVMALLGEIMILMVNAMAQIIDVVFGWIPGVSEAAASMGDAAATALRDTFDTSDIASAGAGQFTAGVGDGRSSAEAAGGTLAEGARTGAGNVDFTDTGSSSGSQYSSGVSSKTSSARGSGSSLGTAARSGASSVSLYSTGTSIGQGLANGISAMWGSVQSAASRLASAAKGAVEKVLAIFSPSRVMRKDGNFFGMGLALGISDQEDNVWKQAAKLGRSAIEAVQTYADTFSEALLDNLNIEPTITPVLDLSNYDDSQLGNSKIISFDRARLNRNADETAYRTDESRVAQGQTHSVSENKTELTVNNKGMMEGATFMVREEADIDRITSQLNRTIGPIIMSALEGRTV